MRSTLLATALVLLGGVADASTPRLAAVRPPGARRGTEVEVTLRGERLGDAREVLWYQPGIETVELVKVDDKNIKAKLRIGPDARLGLHDFRLRTATGISELRSFSVGQYPETDEVEPNNDFQSPQPIPFGVCVNGVAENEDVDYFVVEAKKGDRISAEVEGLRLGITHFDPYVAILDADRFELSASDDAALLRVDGIASAIAPEDGRYIIQVRESAYAGNRRCRYRLHVGGFPRPRAVVPAGGPIGETVEVRWIGDVEGEIADSIAIPADLDAWQPPLVADDRGSSPAPYEFRPSPFGNVIEVEPNDDPDHATPVDSFPVALNGVIEKPGDIDRYRFEAKAGQVLDMNVWARRLRSPLDSVLHIAKQDGTYLMGADDSVGPDSTIRFTAPEDGEYQVFITDHLTQGSPNHFYRIEIAPVAPALTLYAQSEQSAVGVPNVSVAVPRGNRRSALIYATRQDWGGDLTVTPDQLPPGVSAESDVMPASQPVVPVLFNAAPDAPVGGLLTAINGHPTDTSLDLPPSTFTHESVYVFGANNVNFWSRTVDRLAVAVAEEAPFAIEVVEPKVPLVLGGQMDLKVVAHRVEGFNAPIALVIPWLPPGVGASGGVSIPEGQSEITIPMNANGAEQRAWKLVVDATAEGPTGPLTVSSQLFKVEIAGPYLGLEFTNAAVEKGRETDLAVKINKAKDFDGEATVTLIGLPNQAVTDPQTITQATEELVFHIKTTPETPAGNHASLFCQVVVTENGEPITHNIGTAALRVDEPLPPKADAPAAEVAEAPKPAEPADEPAKPLSRLEQLRQEAAARAKARAEAEPGGR